MEISKDKMDMLKKIEKEAHDRIVDIEALRMKQGRLSIYENGELEKRRAYFNGLRTVLDMLEYDF